MHLKVQQKIIHPVKDRIWWPGSETTTSKASDPSRIDPNIANRKIRKYRTWEINKIKIRVDSPWLYYSIIFYGGRVTNTANCSLHMKHPTKQKAVPSCSGWSWTSSCHHPVSPTATAKSRPSHRQLDRFELWWWWHGSSWIHLSKHQWLFLPPVKGGRWHIIPQLAVYTIYIPLIYWKHLLTIEKEVLDLSTRLPAMRLSFYKTTPLGMVSALSTNTVQHWNSNCTCDLSHDHRHILR